MVFIFGACRNGYKIKKFIEIKSGEKADYYIDNNKKKQGLDLDGIKVISFEHVLEIIRNEKGIHKILVALLNPEVVIDQIRDSGIIADVFVLTRKFFANFEQCNLIPDILCKIDYSLHRLDYLEVHVAHHCNLKCKGCGHMSNKIPPQFPDFEQYRKDLARLKTFFWGVKRFRLMGGEPLLNPQLPEYIRETRRTFPDANIRVVSNGLLIPTVNDEIFYAMKEECVGFDISCYHPTAKIRGNIELRCVENEIPYDFSEEIDYFFERYLEEGPKDPYIAYNVCESKTCHLMLEGKISLCPSPVLRSKFKKYTGRKTFEEDIIDLYDKKITSDKLYELMTHPNRQCAYCSAETEFFEWEGYCEE